MKKQKGNTPDPKLSRVDPETGELEETKKREYVTMSLRPYGLGQQWFEKYWRTDVYPQDFVLYEGRKFKPPRYYDKLLEKKDPEMYERVKRKRIIEAKDPKRTWNSSFDRLRVREHIAELKAQRLIRELPEDDGNRLIQHS